MRLRKILLEKTGFKKGVKHYLDKFQNDNKTLLYRQTNTELENGVYEVRPIREGYRMPKGASLFVQVFIDFLIEENNIDAPKRSQSKYAMTERPEKYLFGENTYVVFPEKNANVVSFEEDTAAYRKSIDRAFDKIYFSYRDSIEKYHYFSKFLEESTEIDINDPSTIEEFKDFVRDKWKYIIQDRQNIYRDSSLSDTLKEEVRRFFQGFHDYFDNMKQGIVPGSDEVIFDGEQYFAVDVEYFEDNFEWNRSEWEIKDE